MEDDRVYVDVSGLEAREVLMVLYNAVRGTPPKRWPKLFQPITLEDAGRLICYRSRFESINGVILWLNFNWIDFLWPELSRGIKLDVTSYDAVYGSGTAQQAINAYRQLLAEHT